MNRASRSTPAVNAGVNIARRCGRRSSTPPSGPSTVSGRSCRLREIAEEAGTAKPKIYRHFTDKSDLFQAIGERLRDMLWAAIFPSINVENDPAVKSSAAGVEHYVELVDEHPNVVRFPAPGPVRRPERVGDDERSTRAATSPWRWPTCSTTSCATWSSIRPRSNWPRTPTFGTAASATDWWLGANEDSPRRMPPEDSSRT